MAEFDFPSTNLTDGQTHTENGVTFVWDNTNGAWKKNPASAIKGEPGDSVKGEPGQDGTDGTDGSDGDSVKGQKGEPGSSGSDAQLPVGTIVAYGGNTAPTGWQICNGGTASSSALQTLLGQNNVPDLRDRFIIGAGSNYARHNTGGSKDATLVSHTHNINNHTHSFSTTSDPGNHRHTGGTKIIWDAANGVYGTNSTGQNATYPVSRFDANAGEGEGVADYDLHYTSNAGSHTHSGTTGNPSNRGTNDPGSSGTNANLPPYYALIYIIKT